MHRGLKGRSGNLPVSHGDRAYHRETCVRQDYFDDGQMATFAEFEEPGRMHRMLTERM